MHSVTTAAHTAHLDVMTGTGYLIGPCLDDADAYVWPMFDADLDAMLSELESLGWRLESAELVHAADGRTARMLAGDAVHDPFADGIDFAELARVDAEVLELSGVAVGDLDWD